MKTSLLLLSLLAAGSAIAGPTPNAPVSGPTGIEPIQAAVKDFSTKAVVESVSDTPIAGLKQVQADKQIIYFSADGKYLFAGDVFEVASKRNLTEEARGAIRVELLQSSPQKDHIVYGKPDNPKKIYVFTDTSCGYCQHFHQEVPKLVAAGVTVEFLAWPRTGPSSPVATQMAAVWCAKDRAAAYDSAISGKPVPPSSNCSAPEIVKQFALGEQLEVNGTPAIFAADGQQLGGYVNAEYILKKIGGSSTAGGSK